MLTCRLCAAPLTRTFVDLGMSPLANSYVDAAASEQPETFYPLHARVCDACLLVQLPAIVTPEAIFSDYAYFSSFSTSWLDHARRYADEAIERWGLDRIEPGGRDRAQRRLPAAATSSTPASRCSGVEPAANVAAVAVEPRACRPWSTFFGARLRRAARRDGHPPT